MRYIFLPFFLFRLTLVVTFGLLHQAWLQLPPLLPLSLSLLFVVFVAYATNFLVWPTQVAQFFTPEAVSSSLTPPFSSETHQQYQAELEVWLSIAQLQPNHRDVLLNIARLYQALGDETNYQVYWQQARQLDPNNAIFN